MLARFSHAVAVIVGDEGSLGLWRAQYKLLKLVVHHGMQVEILDLHDNLKGHEVDDAVIGSGLVSQQENIQCLTVQDLNHMKEAEREGDLRTVMHKQFMVLVAELHDAEAVGHFGVQEEMQSYRTWELDEEDREVLRESVGQAALVDPEAE